MTKEQKRLATLLKLSRRAMSEEDFEKVVHEVAGKPPPKTRGRKPLQLSPGDEKRLKLNAKRGYCQVTHVASYLQIATENVRVIYDIDGSGNRKIILTSPDNLSMPTAYKYR